MKQLLILLKMNRSNFLDINLLRHTKDEGERRKLRNLLIIKIFTATMLLALAIGYFYAMAMTLNEIGDVSFVIALAVMVSSVVGIFTSIMRAGPTLFGFRDYDLTMALPVSARTVVLSRVLRLYGTNMFFQFFIMLAAFIAYACFAPITIWFVLGYTLITLLIPLIPITIASFIGTGISLFASRFKGKNLVATVLTIALVVVVVIISMSMQTVVEDFANIAIILADAVRGAYQPAMWVAQALANGNLLYLGLFVLVSIVPFIVFVILVGRFLKPLHQLFVSRSTKRRALQEKDVRHSSKRRALFKKELKRYFSSTLYVTNTAIGAVLALILAVALIFSGKEGLMSLMAEFEFGSEILGALPLLLGMCFGLSSTTNCAISVEGKNYWLLKMLPISTKDILIPKLCVNFILNVPSALICATTISIVVRPSPMDTLMMFLLPLSFILMTSIMGLRLNLSYIKLNWQNETDIVKQGVPMMVNVLTIMFSMMIAIGLVAALRLERAWMLCAVLTFIALLLSVILWQSIRKHATRLMANA